MDTEHTPVAAVDALHPLGDVERVLSGYAEPGQPHCDQRPTAAALTALARVRGGALTGYRISGCVLPAGHAHPAASAVDHLSLIAPPGSPLGHARPYQWTARYRLGHVTPT